MATIKFPGIKGTFRQWKDWANAKSPGSGDQFISWVQANAKVPAPYAFNLDSDSYGPTGFGDNNWAEDYFGAWILLGNVGPDIAKILAQGITAGSKDIPKELKGFGKGVQVSNPLSGLDAIGGFFNSLGQANTWIRVGEVALGLILIAVGVAKMTNAVPIATKIAGVVK